MKKYKIFIPNNSKRFPFLYATPKQHKTPIGIRYISSCTRTVMSELSIYMGTALKTLLKTEKNTSLYNNKFKDIKDYFIIDNRDDVLKYIISKNNANSCYRKSVKSYDFSNLYTSIAHNKLIENITKFVYRIFEVKQKHS